MTPPRRPPRRRPRNDPKRARDSEVSRPTHMSFTAPFKVIFMDAEKRKALEAAGWRFGDAADFLEMTDEERQMRDLRVDAALAVRRQREAMKLSQQQLARR